jgi:colanic acid/amylovoran biosynthesis protein
MMKKIILCGHTGSHNRGCEAIIKSTADLFSSWGVETVLATHDLPYDQRLGISEFSKIVEYAEFRNHPVRRVTSLFLDKILKVQYMANYLRQMDIWKVAHGNIVLNVGGDTYCYDVMPKISINLNKYCTKHNIPCILWGCSVEKEKMNNPEILADLQRYTFIAPRESLTYQNLVQAGISEDKLLLMADPAFTLVPTSCKLPENFVPKNTVGINLSPLVIGWSNNDELVWNNYCNTIDYIINETDMNICLIPHVFRTESDYDMVPHLKLYEKYKNTGRLAIINNTLLNCRQIKYIISQCRFLITARTHASIAAYSSIIPTLVLGYSIKSIGIAVDLFGTSENYVVSTDKLITNFQLRSAFCYITSHEQDIISTLRERIPIMQQRVNNSCSWIISKCK